MSAGEIAVLVASIACWTDFVESSNAYSDEDRVDPGWHTPIEGDDPSVLTIAGPGLTSAERMVIQGSGLRMGSPMDRAPSRSDGWPGDGAPRRMRLWTCDEPR